jgi:hypothetical protein
VLGHQVVADFSRLSRDLSIVEEVILVQQRAAALPLSGKLCGVEAAIRDA